MTLCIITAQPKAARPVEQSKVLLGITSKQTAPDSLQDSAVAAALGQKSYNELVEQLVMVLGDATPKRLLTPQLSRRTSEYSTPRRTSSGLGAVGASDLLSPAELASPLRQTSDTQKAAAPSSKSEAAAASQSGQDAQPAPSALDTLTAAPLGTITSSAGTPPGLHEAAEAGGPAGSLVSAQQPAGPHDSPSSLPAESASGGSQESCPYNAAQSFPALHQLHRPLVSPAADMASRAYPLPAAPLGDGALSTPQSSGTFDAHIATAPTPYPSLASDFSQPGSPASPQGGGGPLAAALKASLAPLGKASTGSLGAGSSSDGKSRLALTTPGHGSSCEKDGAATDAQGAVQSGSAANNQAGASSTASEVATQEGSTVAAEQLVDSAQDLGLPEANSNRVSQQEQQAPASLDVSLAGLKLEDADSEQLQLALAISLGQQEGEAAQEAAQGPVQPHDQPSVSPRASQTGPASESLQAEVTPPASGIPPCATDGPASALPASVIVGATGAGSSSTQAATLPATSAGSTHAEPAPAEALPSDAVQQTPDQPALGAHEAFSNCDAPSELARQNTLDQQRPDLLAAQAGASLPGGRDAGEPAGQPDGDGGTPQQPSNKAMLPGTVMLLLVSFPGFAMHASGFAQEMQQRSCVLSAVSFAMRLTWCNSPHALQCSCHR